MYKYTLYSPGSGWTAGTLVSDVGAVRSTSRVVTCYVTLSDVATWRLPLQAPKCPGHSAECSLKLSERAEKAHNLVLRAICKSLTTSGPDARREVALGLL